MQTRACFHPSDTFWASRLRMQAFRYATDRQGLLTGREQAGRGRQPPSTTGCPDKKRPKRGSYKNRF